jgi:hypothetical protein
VTAHIGALFALGLQVRLDPIEWSLTVSMSRLLMGLGLIILLIGITWPWLSRLGLGRLPGDIVIRAGELSFLFSTCDQHHCEHHSQRSFVATQPLKLMARPATRIEEHHGFLTCSKLKQALRSRARDTEDESWRAYMKSWTTRMTEKEWPRLAVSSD